MAKVRVIPSTIDILTKAPIADAKKRRVAAYARVSTDSDEQLTSYIAQKDYYEKYIKSNDMWEFAGLYADEGISGTNTKKREQFNKMVRDAIEGKIDLIITKSVSRFARNTVDSLSTIRRLKENGVECYFEKENIYTFDSKGELLITLMSSLAQEESRSISENVKWGKRKAMSDGKVVLAYKSFLGYKKGDTGTLEIVEEEAKIVRDIYKWYLEGDSPLVICRKLEKENIKSPGGKEKWRPSTIQSILSNEKYKGDALLQKTYVEDFLSKKVKKNNGEIKQYYVENSHPAIIDKEEWDAVQLATKTRGKLRSTYSSIDLFYGKLKCGECGGVYGRKVWHSNSSYKSERYQCNKKFSKGKDVCQTETLKVEQIEKCFVDAYNEFILRYDLIKETCDLIIEDLLNLKPLIDELSHIDEEIKLICSKAEELVDLNSKVALDQKTYCKEYLNLQTQYNQLNEKHNDLSSNKTLREQKASNVIKFKNQLEENHQFVTEWNRELWATTIDEAIVRLDKTIDFKFITGDVINIKIEI